MIGVWLLVVALAGCAGFVVGHLRVASYWRVGPWGDSLTAMEQTLGKERS